MQQNLNEFCSERIQRMILAAKTYPTAKKMPRFPTDEECKNVFAE
jgi:hypothetical protein